jgi:hypothetical protein
MGGNGGAASRRRLGVKVEEGFFFEKKNQKTFDPGRVGSGVGRTR